MITHELIQGSDAWHQYRAGHDNASEVAAVMGLDPHTTRNELLRIKHTGVGKEFSQFVQERVLDRGHEVEALVRPLIVAMIGEDLYPVTCSEDDGRLSASCDGLTVCDDIAFECKQWNAQSAAQVLNNEVPEQHMPQCQQVLLVTGAKKLIFAVGDGTPENLVTMDVYPDQAWFERIRAAWKQFHIDLAAYTPTETVVPVAAKTVASLPVVFDMRVEGKLVSCNIDQYKPAALSYIAAINTELVTDQNFADADADAKFCRESAKKLELAIEQGLGQMGDINRAIAMVREIAAAFNAKGLALEKSVKAEKDNRKMAIVQAGRAVLHAHEDGLQERTQHHLIPTDTNFEGVSKGLKTITSIQNAIDTELARCKILANATADKIQANLKTIADAGHDFLFADAGALVQKELEFVEMAVKNRVADHQIKEAARVEAEREKIRAEEQAKAERDARAKLADEQAKAALVERDRIAEEAAPDVAPPSHQTVVIEAPKPAQIIPEIIPSTHVSRPTDDEIIEVLADHFDVSRITATGWLRSINFA